MYMYMYVVGKHKGEKITNTLPPQKTVDIKSTWADVPLWLVSDNLENIALQKNYLEVA